MGQPTTGSIAAVEEARSLMATSRQDDSQAVALVRVAAPLTADEQAALKAQLAAVFRHSIELDVHITPEIFGGVWVRVGDTVIDGSLRGRLEALRHHLRTQARIITSMRSTGFQPRIDPE